MTPPPDGPASGWERGLLGKLLGLAGARTAAQLLGLGWFLYAARALPAVEFGELSIGLVAVIVLGGLSDLGTTRTVVRHIAAQPGRLRANFVGAVRVRVGAGLVLGALAVAGAPLLPGDVSRGLLLASALIAVASGVTELAFASLRAVGRVRVEVALLVVERVLFVALGVAVVLAGYGPVAVLLVYAGTNAVSAVAGTVAVVRAGGREPGRSLPMLDAEGRRTAWSSTLVIVGPRLSAVLLVLLATPKVVGAFTIAQKVPDAVGTMGTAALMPVLALLRGAVVLDDLPRARARAERVTAAILAAMLPVTAWVAIDGRRGLDLLFDAGDRRGAATAFALLMASAVVWVLRTLGEVVLLAEERAGRYLRALVAGMLATLVVGVWLVHRWGAAGAGGASLVGECVVLLGVAAGARGPLRPRSSVLLLPGLAATVVATAGVVAARSATVWIGLGVAGVCGSVAATLTALPLRDDMGPMVAEARLGVAGDDADVGQQVGGDLTGDGIEAVEHLARPADHL